MGLIKLTSILRDEKPFSKEVIVDITSIAEPVTENISGNTILFLSETPRSNIDTSINKVKYVVSEDLLTFISLSSEDIFLGNILFRDNKKPLFNKAGFFIDNIVGKIEADSLGSRFLYKEEGSTLPVEYVISEDIPTISSAIGAGGTTPETDPIFTAHPAFSVEAGGSVNEFLNRSGSYSIPPGGGGANLSVGNILGTTLDILSDTGTDATIPSSTTSLAGLMSSSDKSKLDGIAANATANDTDSNLLNRSNHTGTQLSSTISDLSSSISSNSAVVLNTAKITNANHTGDVTGSSSLLIDKTAITNKTTVSASSGDFVLITDSSDTDNLKKVDLSDFLINTNIFNTNGTVGSARTLTITDTLALNGGQINIQGSGTTSGTSSFLVQNSSANDIFRVQDDRKIGINNPLALAQLDIISLGGANNGAGLRYAKSNGTASIAMTGDGSSDLSGNGVLRGWTSNSFHQAPLFLRGIVETSLDVAPTNGTTACINIQGMKAASEFVNGGGASNIRILNVGGLGLPRFGLMSNGSFRFITSASSDVFSGLESSYSRGVPTGFEFMGGQTKDMLLSSAFGGSITNDSFLNSPTFKLQGQYDSDPTASATPTVFNGEIQVRVTAAGASPVGHLSIDLQGVEQLRIDNDSTAGNTRFFIYDVDNATLERVTVGSADSGGVGFKLLRISN